MDRREELARIHNEENREEFAIRREERRLAEEEREMERELKDFDDAEERTKRQIENEWRREGWGHQPEHPPVRPKP